jgi:hypothetical protein
VYNLWKTGPTVGWEMDMLIALAPISDTFRFQTGVENVLVFAGWFRWPGITQGGTDIVENALDPVVQPESNTTSLE